MRSVSRVSVINKRLKKGYTTGTCAAAASAAAAKMLFGGEVVSRIEVELPGGRRVEFDVVDIEKTAENVGCCIVKDAGDDPDVTDGMKICARVARADAGITIRGGEGIGTVTKPGLAVAVGEPAINPVPRAMITANVSRNIPDGAGVEVTIFAPEGTERAKKTFNARLGIVGGISILGTTGIVRPMSLDSLKASLTPQVDIALALGYKTIALVPGNMGAKAAESRLKFPPDAIVQMSNFVGYMLDYCVKAGVERVVLLGHIGKLVKVAAGHFDTHSGKTDDPVEIMKRLIRNETKDIAPMTYMIKVNTAEDAALGLAKLGYSRMLDKIAQAASAQARAYVDGNLEIGTAITVLSGEIVASDSASRKIVKDAAW